MRKFLSILIVALLTWGLMVADADARRFGGGKSFGASRPSVSRSANKQPAANNAATNGGGMGRGLIGGLIIGGLLTSLFMGNGLGTGLVTWIVLLSVVYLIWSFLRNHGLVGASMQRGQYQQQYQSSGFTSASNSASFYPSGFKVDDFLRGAKVLFMRMQVANDLKNIDDIYQFTSPEVAAEIQMQFQERGAAENKTEVLKLDAELLDASVENNTEVASVLFSGVVREAESLSPQAFQEIWHFQRSTITQKWVIAGLQQN